MPNEEQTPPPSAGYGIAADPVVGLATRASVDGGDDSPFPRAYGDPFVVAIPRDPTALFVCWSVDWNEVFHKGAPPDRQVHLRARVQNGDEETTVAAEPMKETGIIEGLAPGETYSVELGYFDAGQMWNRVAISEAATMPATGTTASPDFEIATVPLHLSFQRMIELFRQSSSSAVIDSVARLQSRAASEGSAALTRGEREMLRVLEFNDAEADRRAEQRASFAATGEHFARRVEALLGIGATSPTGSSTGGS